MGMARVRSHCIDPIPACAGMNPSEAQDAARTQSAGDTRIVFYSKTQSLNNFITLSLSHFITLSLKKPPGAVFFMDTGSVDVKRFARRCLLIP